MFPVPATIVVALFAAAPCGDAQEECVGSLGPYSSTELWSSECEPGGDCITLSLEPHFTTICRIELTLNVRDVPVNAVLYLQEVPGLTPDIVATSAVTITESGQGVVASFEFDDVPVETGLQYFLRLDAREAYWLTASSCEDPRNVAYLNDDAQPATFWHRIEGSSPTPTEAASWGSIKAVHR